MFLFTLLETGEGSGGRPGVTGDDQAGVGLTAAAWLPRRGRQGARTAIVSLCTLIRDFKQLFSLDTFSRQEQYSIFRVTNSWRPPCIIYFGLLTNKFLIKKCVPAKFQSKLKVL